MASGAVAVALGVREKTLKRQSHKEEILEEPLEESKPVFSPVEDIIGVSFYERIVFQGALYPQ